MARGGIEEFLEIITGVVKLYIRIYGANCFRGLEINYSNYREGGTFDVSR